MKATLNQIRRSRKRNLKMWFIQNIRKGSRFLWSWLRWRQCREWKQHSWRSFRCLQIKLDAYSTKSVRFNLQDSTHMLDCSAQQLRSVPFQRSAFNDVKATIVCRDVHIINSPCLLHSNLKSRPPIVVRNRDGPVDDIVRQYEWNFLPLQQPFERFQASRRGYSRNRWWR